MCVMVACGGYLVSMHIQWSFVLPALTAALPFLRMEGVQP